MAVDDADLARVLHRHVDDVFTWLADSPADEVDPAAVAAVRRSLDRVTAQRAAGPPDPLRTAVGLLADVMWWLDTCGDDEVDPSTAVRIQEGTGASLDELTENQRRRVAEVLDDLAASEPHAGRRYEIRFFAFAMDLAHDEPEDEAPAVREWVRPEDRTH